MASRSARLFQAFQQIVNEELPTLCLYMRHDAKPVADVYVKMNGIVRFEVCNHHHGDPGYQLWEMTGDTTGFPHYFRRQRRAIQVAKELSAFTGLPYKIIRARRKDRVVQTVGSEEYQDA